MALLRYSQGMPGCAVKNFSKYLRVVLFACFGRACLARPTTALASASA